MKIDRGGILVYLGALGAFLKLPGRAPRLVFSDYFGNSYEGSTTLSGIDVVDLVEGPEPEVLVTHADEGWDSWGERIDIYSRLKGSDRFSRIGSMNTSSHHSSDEGPGSSRSLIDGPTPVTMDGKRLIKLVYREFRGEETVGWMTELYAFDGSSLSLEESVTSDDEL
jgi:hypothetical protein